jgi:large repetitive protein
MINSLLGFLTTLDLRRAIRLNPAVATAAVLIALAAGSLGVSAFTTSSQIPSVCFDEDAIVGTTGDDKLKGTTGDDVLIGRKGDDVIKGKGGNDVICGRGGDDTIKGGRGNDTVLGGSGDDTLRGSPGDDTLTGGSGTDTIDGGVGTDTCDGESETNCEEPATPSPTPSATASPTPTPTTTASPTPTPPTSPPNNLKPVAANDTYATDEDQTLNVAAPGVLANDSDPENGLNGAMLLTNAVNGDVAFNQNGSFVYTPDANFNGADTFTYAASDGNSQSAPATVTINVAPVADPPTATAQNVGATEDTFEVVSLFGNDTDGPDPSIFKITSLPSDGDLRNGSGLGGQLIAAGDLPFTLTGNQVTYVPDANFFGLDDFDFKANDGALDSGAAPVSITVASVNDAPTDVNLSNNSVDEELAVGATVGNLSAVDPDAGDLHQFGLVAGAGDTDNARFQIQGGTLKTNEVFDFETQGPFSIRVKGQDAAGAFFEKQFSVTLNNVNDAPVVTGGTFSLPENSANGTAVGTPSVADQDAAQTHTWSISGGNSGSAFAIDSTTGAITVADTGELDFEDVQQWVLTVRAEDNGTPAKSDTDTVTIDLTNVNEAPTDIQLQNTSVAENQPVATAVGNLVPIDPDNNDTHTFSLVAGAGDGDNNRFQITNGVLETAQSFDFETQGPFSVRIRARDAGNLDYEEVFSISVTDANDAPVVSPATVSLDENSANGSAVHTVAATDEDSPAQTLTYAITGGNTLGAFQIDQSTGAITVADTSDIDFETTPQFVLTVQVDDDGTPTKNDSETITINLNNLNESPVVNAATLSLAENSANGTSVGTATGSDPDAGQTLTWAITGGNTGNAFAINAGTGEITVADVNDVDFEQNPTFALVVEATDNGAPTLSDTETVTVNLTNVNETPTDISLNDTDVAENASLNTVVGTISGSDPDAGDAASLVFSLAPGAGDTDNGRFNVGPSNSLRTSEVFDKETQGPFSIRLRATDGGNLQYEEVFQIDVADVNEWPDVGDQTLGLDENSANGTAVGTASATDPDVPAQTFTWAITGGNTLGAFAINANTGQITVADVGDVDFETNPTFALTVQATDNGSPPLSDTGTITINLNDLNDAPVVSAATLSLAENSANGTSAGTASATDQDLPAQTLAWAITGGNIGGAFQINPSTGEITVADTNDVDFETNHPFSLTVEATDNGTPNRTGSNTITVNLTNVNEAPVITAPATVSAQYQVAKAIGGISVADPDAGNNAVVMTMSVLDGTLSLDTTVLNGLVAGDVAGNGTDVLAIGGTLTEINNTLGAANGLTYTSDNGFTGLSDTLAIVVNDGGNSGSGIPLSDTENVTIQFNTPPVATDQTVSTNEDTEKTVTLAGTDADADPLTYKITALPAAGKLHEGTTSAGTLITAGALPYSLPADKVTYVPPANQNGLGLETFQFKANDGSTDSPAGIVTVDVSAVNDAPELANTGANLDYDENDAATPISTDFSVDDIDSALTGVTVQITGNYANGQDVLSYPGGFGVTATPFNAGTGTLTLSGSTTLANYLSAIEAVSYHNTSEDPSELTRTVTYTVSDGALTDTATAGIDVTKVNDLPVLTTPGNDLAYTENDAATAINSAVTVNDVDHVNASGATVQITGNYANGQDVLSFVNAFGITAAPFDASTGTLTLSGNTTFANYEDALQTVKYHNTSENPSALTRTVTFTVNDGVGNGTDTHGITVTPVNDAPIADLDSLAGNKSALANTTLDNGVSSTEPIHIDTASNENVLDGDFDHEGDTFSLVAGADCIGASAPFTCTTDGHDPDGPGGNAPLTGTVTLHANGLFEYDPPAGFTGTDTFQYRVSDNQPVNPTSDGTVNINVAGPLVWYVDDSAGPGGNGTSSSMYQTLAPLTGGADPDGTGDRIFVRSGNYLSGIVLENNQKLIGEPNGFAVTDSLTRNHNLLAAGGTAPAISHAANTVVTLGSGNELQDLALGNGTIALAGTNVGAPLVRDTSINTNGKAVDVNGATAMDMVFSTLTSNGSPTEGIKLNNAAGTFTANGGTLQNATNAVVDINGATQDVTIAGNISDGSGPVISITNSTGGTKDFNGTVTGTSGGSGPRINLTSNPNTTVRFDNDVSMNTTTLPAVNAVGVGTLHMGSDDNVLTTTTGTPLTVVNTTIGATDLVFDSISSNGAANGIVLDNTGNTGNLHVTGNPGADTNEGGTIAATSGADAATVGCAKPGGQPAGIGILLKDTNGVILNDMVINGSSNFGLLAHDVNGFTLDDSTFNGAHGNNDGQDEGTAHFCDLTGAATISDSVIGGAVEDGLKVRNVGGVLNRLTVSNTDFATGLGGVADDAFEASSTGGGTFNVTVNGGSAFTTAAGDHLQYSVAGSGTGDVVVQNNAFSNNYPSALGGGVTINPGGNSSNVNVTYNVTGNTFRDSTIPALTVTTGGALGATGTYSGTISNNQIGVTGVVGSGAAQNSSGISFHHIGSGSHTVSIIGNTVKQYTLAGIRLLANGGNSTVRATIHGNTINEPVVSGNLFAGISVEMGSSVSTVSSCIDLGSVAQQNAVGSAAPSGTPDIIVFPDGSSTMNLPGYVGPTNGAAAATAVAAYLLPRNNGGGGAPEIFANDLAPIQYTGTGSNCL